MTGVLLIGRLVLPATGFLLLAGPAGAQEPAAEIAGRAMVIDGDTIEVCGQRLSLLGIDAPEARQLCHFRERPYPCGRRAGFA